MNPGLKGDPDVVYMAFVHPCSLLISSGVQLFNKSDDQNQLVQRRISMDFN